MTKQHLDLSILGREIFLLDHDENDSDIESTKSELTASPITRARTEEIMSPAARRSHHVSPGSLRKGSRKVLKTIQSRLQAIASPGAISNCQVHQNDDEEDQNPRRGRGRLSIRQLREVSTHENPNPSRKSQTEQKTTTKKKKNGRFSLRSQNRNKRLSKEPSSGHFSSKDLERDPSMSPVVSRDRPVTSSTLESSMSSIRWVNLSLDHHHHPQQPQVQPALAPEKDGAQKRNHNKKPHHPLSLSSLAFGWNPSNSSGHSRKVVGDHPASNSPLKTDTRSTSLRTEERDPSLSPVGKMRSPIKTTTTRPFVYTSSTRRGGSSTNVPTMMNRHSPTKQPQCGSYLPRERQKLERQRQERIRAARLQILNRVDVAIIDEDPLDTTPLTDRDLTDDDDLDVVLLGETKKNDNIIDGERSSHHCRLSMAGKIVGSPRTSRKTPLCTRKEPVMDYPSQLPRLWVA